MDLLLKQPHDVAEGVLHDLAETELIKLAKGFPVDADIQKRIEQELRLRQIMNDKRANSPAEQVAKNLIYPAIAGVVAGIIGGITIKLLGF